MKKLTLKAYQNLIFLMLTLGFSEPAMASDFSVLPTMLTLWISFPVLIIELFIISIIPLIPTKQLKTKFIFFFLGIILALSHLPFLLLDMWHIYALLGFQEDYGSSFTIGGKILAILFYMAYGYGFVLLIKSLYHYWQGKRLKIKFPF